MYVLEYENDEDLEEGVYAICYAILSSARLESLYLKLPCCVRSLIYCHIR